MANGELRAAYGKLRIARRATSWLGATIAAAVLVIGLTHLPGSGGVLGELRWSFRWPTPGNLNRAHVLFELIEQRSPGSQIQILDTLLNAEARTAQEAGLSLTAAALRGTQRNPPTATREQALAPFLHWLARLAPGERLQFQPYPLLIAELPRAQREASGLLTPADLGWMIAGTAERRSDWRERAEMLVFRPAPAEPGIRQRLAMLDAARPVPGHLAPLAPADVAAELVPPGEELAALLADADPRVSGAAGRILAVSGDPRGVPTLSRWLQQNPQMTAGTNKLMTALFGPDWRDLGESGSPAREPGARDGRY